MEPFIIQNLETLFCLLLFEVVQLIISTDCSSRLSLSQCFSKKINKPLGISRFWYYERLHFLTESNKSLFLRGLKASIFVKKVLTFATLFFIGPRTTSLVKCIHLWFVRHALIHNFRPKILALLHIVINNYSHELDINDQWTVWSRFD